MPYAYVLLRSRDHVAMVDVGYNHADYGKTLAETYGVQHWHGPQQALALCGLTPGDVDTIFITHAHFDHFGNVEAFPKARFYVARQEIERSLWALALPERLSLLGSAIDPGDLAKGAALAAAGRLVLVDQDMEDVLPGIDLHLAPDTHSYASIWVEVRNDGRRESSDAWVLAGDLIYSYDNLGGLGSGIEGNPPFHPIGIAVGSQEKLLFATEAMVKAVGYERRRVVPVHEAALLDVFPSRRAAPGLAISEVCLADGAASRIG
jgi:glyoxylase-like metal-dependent hydrolase (beta-lactamase superfamily II)